MKIASIEWQWPVHVFSHQTGELPNTAGLLDIIKHDLQKANEQGADLVVFPGFAGLLFLHLQYPKLNLHELVQYADAEEYQMAICKLSHDLPLAICLGSYWVEEDERVFTASCIIEKGHICLEQKQIYLSRWEQDIGLCRGVKQEMLVRDDWRIGIVVGSDVFYPQVSRGLALNGANLILAPVGFVGEPNQWQQVSGIWSSTQQNQFFAVESGLNGMIAEMTFWGESMIHAPVEMTPHVDGFLVRTGLMNPATRLNGSMAEEKYAAALQCCISGYTMCSRHSETYSVGSKPFLQSTIITADLDLTQRQKAIAGFDVIRQLHPQLYREMKLFGGA